MMMEGSQWRDEKVELVPEEGKENIMITSALPYVNNVPHLGNIIGSVLSADVYSRFCKQDEGVRAIYICGTDEYGTATETAALMQGTTPERICAKYFEIHDSIYKWFNIGFDHFGRSSNGYQGEVTRSIFRDMYANGYVDEMSSEQLYCEKDDRFLADRFVEGTCSHCGYENARGDQCDMCTNLLNPIDLIDPKCKICGSTPYLRETVHMYLDLPLLSGDLEKWFSERSDVGNWSKKSISTTLAWLRKGLAKRSITRDLRWGTSLPEELGERYKEKVFYVWFDAPIGYISITADYSPENWRKWWLDNSSVKLVQFMGKDNVPFHTIVFPSTLLATRKSWTMLYTISTTEYLMYEGGKFSKSRNIGVFGDQVQMAGLPPDLWRYYLISIRPESRDTDFSWDDFRLRVNSDLADNIGNYCNRVIKFIHTYYDGIIPNPESTEEGKSFISNIENAWQQYKSSMQQIQLRNALNKILEISHIGNEYLQKSKPWKLIAQDRNTCSTIINLSASLLKLISLMLFPFTPVLSVNILKQLNFVSCADIQLLQKHHYNLNNAYKTTLKLPTAPFPQTLIPANHPISSPQILISKITQKDILAYKCLYSSTST